MESMICEYLPLDVSNIIRGYSIHHRPEWTKHHMSLCLDTIRDVANIRQTRNDMRERLRVFNWYVDHVTLDNKAKVIEQLQTKFGIQPLCSILGEESCLGMLRFVYHGPLCPLESAKGSLEYRAEISSYEVDDDYSDDSDDDN